MQELEEKLKYTFQNKDLLIQALTHSSYSNEHKLRYDYERLEYLGDSVLELVVSDWLVANYPESREGELTKIRASLVCEAALSEKAKSLDINKYIFLGKGEMKSHGAEKSSILCDVFEAVVGAIFKDGGYYEAENFILNSVLNDVADIKDKDTKSKLQEYVQNKNLELEYVLVEETGADHEKNYTVAVHISGKEYARASAKSKKAAEQKAAGITLKKLKVYV